MENPEDILHSLDEFVKLKPKVIPKELEDYLAYVAKTGDPVFQWHTIKFLFREKLVSVITDFYETSPASDLPQCPNVDPFNYEIMKNSLIERLESFTSAPFTVQRLCELMTKPRKEYNRVDKFMRAIEKNLLVVSTREPGNVRSDNGHEVLMNGIIEGRNIELCISNDAVNEDSVNYTVSNENVSPDMVLPASDDKTLLEYIDSTHPVVSDISSVTNEFLAADDTTTSTTVLKDSVICENKESTVSENVPIKEVEFESENNNKFENPGYQSDNELHNEVEEAAEEIQIGYKKVVLNEVLNFRSEQETATEIEEEGNSNDDNSEKLVNSEEVEIETSVIQTTAVSNDPEPVVDNPEKEIDNPGDEKVALDQRTSQDDETEISDKIVLPTPVSESEAIVSSTNEEIPEDVNEERTSVKVNDEVVLQGSTETRVEEEQSVQQNPVQNSELSETVTDSNTEERMEVDVITDVKDDVPEQMDQSGSSEES